MHDPFAELGDSTPKPEDEEMELVGGAFSCQNNSCYEIVGQAKYFPEILLLTWKCKDGHISKIRDFNL